MNVDNIFELTKKFSKEEDQLSANFGFILKNNKEILESFLTKLNISISQKELKIVDIETQTTYDSGKSRIDLQLSLYDRFLVFIESKICKNEEQIFEQLKKYKFILDNKIREFDSQVRLVYVNKFSISRNIVENLAKKLNISNDKFYFLTWEDLIKLVEPYQKKETVKLFRNYISDTMYKKKIIKEQKIKNVVEVLVAYTNPMFWELTEKKKVAVQKNSAPDAKYIAFLRIDRGNKLKGAITHIGEVEYTEMNVPAKNSIKGFPKLIENAKKKDWWENIHKEYHLSEIIELPNEIPCLKGERKGQVYFLTKMSELLKAKSVGKIKSLNHLRLSSSLTES